MAWEHLIILYKNNAARANERYLEKGGYLMKTKSKSGLRFISAVLSILMLMSVFASAAVYADDIPTTGVTGDCTWSFDEAYGKLTISGTGAMGEEKGYEVFKDKIADVVFEDGVTTISEKAFEDFNKIISVSMADTVTEIKSRAFSGCNMLQSISFSSNLKTIGDYAFAATTSLDSVTFPDSLESIGDYAFYLSGIRSVKFNAGLKSVGEHAFMDTNLTHVEIPEETSTIGAHAFGFETDAESGDVVVDGFYIVGREGTASHQYAGENNIKFVHNTTPKVIFNAEGGVIDGDDIMYVDPMRNYTLDSLPTPERYGYIFEGWFYDANQTGTADKQVFATETAFYENSTEVFAKWAQANGELIKNFFFESDPVNDGWTFVDKDDDGNNWKWETVPQYDYEYKRRIPEGKGVISSASGDDTVMTHSVVYDTVDDWAISPAIEIPDGYAEVNVFAHCDNPNYIEKLELYAGLSADVDSMEKISDGDLTTQINGDSVRYTGYLSEFIGKKVYIAIRHLKYNTEGAAPSNSRLIVDMVQVHGDYAMYGIEILGNPITSKNKDDVLGDGVFRLEVKDDGSLVLHVNGDCEAGANKVDWPIINARVPLTIQIDGDSNLTHDYGDGIVVYADTTIAGTGKLTVDADNFGIYLNNIGAGNNMNATLKFDGVRVEVTGGTTGIKGSDDLAKVVFNDSEVTADGARSAVYGFGDGIDVTDCEIIEPEKATTDGGMIKTEGGEIATHVVIGNPTNPFTEPTEDTSNTYPSYTSEQVSGGNETGDTSDTQETTNPTASASNETAATEPTESTDPDATGDTSATENTDATAPTTSGDGTDPFETTDPNGRGDTTPTGDATTPNNDNKDNGGNNNKDNGTGKDSGTDENKNITEIKEGTPIKAVDKFVTKFKSEDDPKGSVFGLLCARQKTVKKNKITIRWNKLKNAKKYVVYASKCGTKKGSVPPFKKIKTVKKNTFTYSKLKKGTYYKFLVVALDKNNKVVTTSKTVHVVTKGGKNGNDKTVSLNKSSVSLKKGKTFKIKAKEVPQSKSKKVKRHRKVAYESSNKKIAKVSKGKITAKKKGTAYIYVYAQNGLYKKVKVTVK